MLEVIEVNDGVGERVPVLAVSPAGVLDGTGLCVTELVLDAVSAAADVAPVVSVPEEAVDMTSEVDESMLLEVGDGEGVRGEDVSETSMRG